MKSIHETNRRDTVNFHVLMICVLSILIGGRLDRNCNTNACLMSFAALSIFVLEIMKPSSPLIFFGLLRGIGKFGAYNDLISA